MDELTNSDVFFSTLAITAYPLLRSTIVTTAPLWLAVAYPMTHLFPRFNMQRPLDQRPTVGDSLLPVSATCIAPPILLKSQVLPKRPPPEPGRHKQAGKQFHV